jgi:hypothetical protein
MKRGHLNSHDGWLCRVTQSITGGFQSEEDNQLYNNQLLLEGDEFSE